MSQMQHQCKKQKKTKKKVKIHAAVDVGLCGGGAATAAAASRVWNYVMELRDEPCAHLASGRVCEPCVHSYNNTITS